MSKETVIVGAIIGASLLGVGTVAFTEYPEISVDEIDSVQVVTEPTEEPVVMEHPITEPVVESIPAPTEKVVAPETDEQVKHVTGPVTPPVPGETDPAEENEHTLRYCESEDSEDCYWDADILGNGQGRSFVNIDGMVYYLP